MFHAAFPSPCGVNIVGNATPVEAVTATPVEAVSVPLRGKYCRESQTNTIAPISICNWFPSPCGVNIVGNLAGSN